MKLTRIDSTNARQPSWQILKEWEEVLSQKTGLPVYRDNRLIRYIKAHFDKWGMSFLWKILVTRKNLAYIIHSGFISGYQNRYGDNLKPPTNVYHRMTA